MSARDPYEDPEALRRAYQAKARAELAAADRLLGGRVPVTGSGDPLGRVLLIKGAPGPDDTAAGSALAGADGAAAAKALQALGLDPASVWRTCSRPGPGDAAARARRLELAVEAVDPALVLALDADASQDLSAALGLTPLRAGRPEIVRGRVLGAVDGLEASLTSEAAKARVWRQMKAVARSLPPHSLAGETREGRP